MQNANAVKEEIDATHDTLSDDESQDDWETVSVASEAAYEKLTAMRQKQAKIKQKHAQQQARLQQVEARLAKYQDEIRQAEQTARQEASRAQQLQQQAQQAEREKLLGETEKLKLQEEAKAEQLERQIEEIQRARAAAEAARLQAEQTQHSMIAQIQESTALLYQFTKQAQPDIQQIRTQLEKNTANVDKLKIHCHDIWISGHNAFSQFCAGPSHNKLPIT